MTLTGGSLAGSTGMKVDSGTLQKLSGLGGSCDMATGNTDIADMADIADIADMVGIWTVPGWDWGPALLPMLTTPLSWVWLR